MTVLPGSCVHTGLQCGGIRRHMLYSIHPVHRLGVHTPNLGKRLWMYSQELNFQLLMHFPLLLSSYHEMQMMDKK